MLLLLFFLGDTMMTFGIRMSIYYGTLDDIARIF